MLSCRASSDLSANQCQCKIRAGHQYRCHMEESSLQPSSKLSSDEHSSQTLIQQSRPRSSLSSCSSDEQSADTADPWNSNDEDTCGTDSAADLWGSSVADEQGTDFATDLWNSGVTDDRETDSATGRDNCTFVLFPSRSVARLGEVTHQSGSQFVLSLAAPKA